MVVDIDIMQLLLQAQGNGGLVVDAIEPGAGEHPQVIVDISKEIVDRTLHTQTLDDAIDIGNKALGHQVDTSHRLLVLEPDMMKAVEVEMIVPVVFGQRKQVFGLWVDMGERLPIVEVNVSDGGDDHTACLGARDGLGTVVCQSVGSVVRKE